ncbi:glycoside hydrolase family 32 protein [Asaia bogorensis]|uniref:glycoside hydrolase family 32 protein n=1 Tax=Asaia bogorensis TaxID=91915 RepID=UPI000EFC756B|nr:glycoside hydrolase family 32 protein [Asaia bogorensis]
MALLLAGGRSTPAMAAQRFPPDHMIASDPFRPISHFAAPRGWMNDPCGPIWVDGVYHLFYQWNPESALWDNMHWGHATSADLVNWVYRPVALSPQHDGPDRDGVFTGDVVIDSGRAVAIYTGFRFDRAQAQVQCMATSDLDMIHWTQSATPVLAAGPDHLKIGGFRDPKLWREDKTWIMLVGSKIDGLGGVILRYESPDLKDWSFRRIFYGPSDLHGGDDVLECPDFFSLGTCHALVFSINSVVHVVTGQYEKGQFQPVRQDVLGYGGFYAARSFLDAQGRRTVLGWLTEKPWQAGEAASRGWSGVLSYPRLLAADAEGQVLATLHPEMESMTGEELFDGVLRAGMSIDGPQVRIRVRFEALAPGSMVFAHTDRYMHLDFDPAAKNRELACNEDRAPLPKTPDVTLDIYVDGSVIEIFTSTGKTLSARAYGNPSRPFTLSGTGCFANARCQVHALLPARFRYAE